MKIRIIACFILGVLSLGEKAFAQAAQPTGGSAVAANRGESVPVNYYTGIPSISIPLYSYAHRNGIGMNVSLDYFAGGIKVNEAPSPAGLGWNLSAGGVITRTVRGGVPDDEPMIGYMNHTVPFNLASSDRSAYFSECRDPEQDVFQFNFMGNSGKFFIGNDTSVFMTSLSKIRIKFNRIPYDDASPPPNPGGLDSVHASIQNFVITTEDGVKYYFNEPEQQTMIASYCTGGGGNVSANVRLFYSTAWYLTKIVSALGTDSIKISYTGSQNSGSSDYYQTVTINGSSVTHSDTVAYNDMGAIPTQPGSKVPSEITFPDAKKISFYYSNVGQFRYAKYPLLQRVKIMDSALIYGYMLNWDTTGMGTGTRDFLSGINYFTGTAIKPGYKFTYNTPYFGLQKLICQTISGSQTCIVDTTDNFANKKDHWGYYNGANNGRDYVPSIPGVYNGANREPNNLAVASTIQSVQDPSGGITYYDFENNDVYPYTNARQSIAIDAAQTTQNSMSISRVWGSKTYFKIALLTSNASGSPVSGSGDMTVAITNTAGTTTYASKVVSLHELYNAGYLNFALAVAPGNYLIKTNLAGGTASSSALSSEISWYNQTAASGTGILTGGIRIKRIRHYDPFTNKSDTLSTYSYLQEDGKSSGFLGTKPLYDYYSYGGIRHISSQVINDFDFSQGNKVGYNRVEVIKGSAARNLGKQVYEFTNGNDRDFDSSPMEYPFMQRAQQDWALGLPKRVLTYDNAGRLIQSQTNTYSYITKLPQADSVFRSLRMLQRSSGGTNGNAGSFYYPEAGRADLIASADTFYHPDNSITTNSKTIEYDTNYNAIKITTPYDRNRNLNLEKRIYYPYNYTLTDAIGRLRDSSIVVPVSTEAWITGDGNPRLLSATATAFANGNGLGGGLIRPSMAYALQSNAPVPQSVIGSFDPSVLVRNTTYIFAQQSYNYDQKGFLLQATALPSNISGTSVYGYANTRVIATVSNAKRADVDYSSFEPASPGTWDITSTARDSTDAVTGRYAYNLSNGQINKAGLNASLTYLITYWTKGSVSFSVSGNVQTLDQRNGWTLASKKISGVTDFYIYGSGLMDELRLYPADAAMATTCYERTGELNSSCDAGNNITYYEYDNANRLKVIRNKDKNVVKKIEYSDLVTTVSMVPNWVAFDSTYWECEKDTADVNTGRVLRQERDTNPYSETYQSLRMVYDHTDTGRCPVPAAGCPDDGIHAVINGVCEEGCRVNTSSVRTKIVTETGTTYVWVCTYHYEWSNATHSGNYTESNPSPCTIGNLCD